MATLILLVFVLGYIAMAMEHAININKTATALLTGVLCWSLFVLAPPMDAVLQSKAYQAFVKQQEFFSLEKISAVSSFYHAFINDQLAHHLASISQIIFFLLGAMTIVELIDAYEGFRVITDKIKTQNPKKLLWIVAWLSFFLSAVLDNLTTSIVMVSLLRKLVHDSKTRMLYAGIVIIAANAGGAWTPIGDVTTTMLWIGGQITSLNIMQTLFLPSVLCLLAPLLWVSLTMRNTTQSVTHHHHAPPRGSKTIFTVGLLALIFVPAFKTLTHLPPYVGMLLGLGVLWIVSEFINPHADETIGDKKKYTIAGALSRIDTPSILFFLGILLAVACLETMTTLHHAAEWLTETVGNQTVVVTLIGVLSAVVDNVPLVAASMGMYPLETFPTDCFLWEYLAYCAGTGGSLLIIGSAAGVAVMGMEKIDFMWYVKRVSLLALLGYLVGCAAYIVQYNIMHGV